jgi:hypothetical protein
LTDWVASIERHPAAQQVPFHYHDVEEWLQVREGEMSFVSITTPRRGVARASPSRFSLKPDESTIGVFDE